MHLMIRPIMPYDIPKLTENPFVLISGFVLVITAVLIAVVLSRYAAEAYKGNRKKATLFFAGITAFVTLMLFCFFGCAATTFKGIIFCLLLLFSSYEDIRVRECEDYVHLMIVIAAFIGTDTARTMLANSEFVIMLNQASTDRIKLAELLNISDTQLSYITNVEAGRGLMKVGSALVPFINKFPKNTKLYALMTTKFGER